MTLARHSVPLSGAGRHINNKPSDWPPVSIVSRSGAGPLANNKSPGWLVQQMVEAQLLPGRADRGLCPLRML